MIHRCPDCKRSVKRCSCEKWWRECQVASYEAHDSALSGKALSQIPRWMIASAAASANMEAEDISARIFSRPKAQKIEQTKVCVHAQPLRFVTDSTVVCWDCGQSFEVKPL